MKSFFVIAAFVFFLNVSSYAQAGELGPSLLLKQGEILRGRFEQNYYWNNDKDVFRSKGHFMLESGRGVLWAIEQPVPLTMIATPLGSAQSIGGMVLMRQSAAQNVFGPRILDAVSALLAGKRAVLARDYLITESGDPKKWCLKVLPRKEALGPNLSFDSLLVCGMKSVENALLIDKHGRKTTVIFTEQRVSPAGSLLPQEEYLFSSSQKEGR